MNSSLFGLIGYPLGHSFSKNYFTRKFEKEGHGNCSYELFPITDIHQLPELIKAHPNLKGLNVTIPYKELVIPSLDSIDPLANRIGAVNVIKIDSQGKLHGYNSDFTGFAATLLSLKLVRDRENMKALVFGTGGSSKAITTCLEEFGIRYLTVSRTSSREHLGYEDLMPDLIEQYPLLINCTPVGMHPHPDNCIPIPYHTLSAHHIAIDLVYNPEETLFMRKVRDQGGVAINGLTMLHAQAEKAWEIWNS